MAKISPATNEKIFAIKKWLGLNESPDGDTRLKYGEASVMRNWKITRDNTLQRRPGTQRITGVLQTYTLDTAATAELFRTDEAYSATLTMYPAAAASTSGFVTLSGTTAAVNFSNSATYVNYYWSKDYYHIWKLAECVYDAATDTYSWYGYKMTAVSASANQNVAGLWTGFVNGREYVLAACDGKLWKIYDGADWCKTEIGSIDTTSTVTMFGYSNIVYILDGKKYRSWDGTTYGEVAGYRPLVVTEAVPSGGGTSLEQVNKLNGTRRMWFSPDGSATAFHLPETAITSVDWVKNRAAGTTYTVTTDYTVNLTTGVVTFTTHPDAGTDTIEIAWTVDTDDRSTIEGMKFSETFNGAQDTRVFLYGDGTNVLVYSGLDYDGNSRADYFPDMNVAHIGASNTPVTAVIRHYSRMVVYKTDSTYYVGYGTITLADGSTIASFSVVPVNRSIGNVAPGQARLVQNSPRTLHGKDCYEWKNSSSYSSNLTIDERQAKRISDRIYSTLKQFDLDSAYCWDDNDHQEYYICYDGNALVHNYAADAWYYYTDFDAACMVNFHGELYFGTSDGKIEWLDKNTRTDNGEAIDAYWESGSVDFGADYMRKYSSVLWVSVKPEASNYVEITVKTDVKSEYAAKDIVTSVGLFGHLHFAAFSFLTSTKPQIKKIRIKAKKFTYYKLIFQTDKVDTTATVLGADFRVRMTGYAK